MSPSSTSDDRASRSRSVPFTSVPFTGGQDGYATFRIPAIIRTGAGTLLAFAEGRRDGRADSGAIDLVVRRSGDGGRTWGPLAVVAGGDGDTHGNPVPVFDPAAGRVVLVNTRNDGTATQAQIMAGEVSADQGRRVLVRVSDDDGLSFSASRDITATARMPLWRWYATGPGHAIVLAHGPYAGRIVVAGNHSVPPLEAEPTHTGREPRYHGAHAILSDDHGATWRLGFVADDPTDDQVNADENTVAELPDGRLYFNCRNQHGTTPSNRLDAYSLDGGTTLSTPLASQDTLADVPVVEGSTLQVPDGPLLFCGPGERQGRARLTIFASHDNGATFTRALEISHRPAGYSDLVQLDASTVGVLYETGARDYDETITFTRIPLKDLHP